MRRLLQRIKIRYLILRYQWQTRQISRAVRQIYRAEHELPPWAPVDAAQALEDVLDNLGKIFKAERREAP